MQKIIRKNGFVYLVENWDRKGFETYHNMGKDIDDPKWKEEKEEVEKMTKRKKTKKDVD